MRVELEESLVEALGLSRGDLVSLVGAGGKTSLMYALGREVRARGWPVVLTTTTKIMYPRPAEARAVVIGEESAATVVEISRRLSEGGVVVAGRERAEAKIVGFSTGFVEKLRTQAGWTVIAECDGARGRSLKAPRQGEPPVPETTDLFVVVVGADCLGKRLDSEAVFEPEQVAAVAGVGVGSAVDKALIMKVVLSPESYLGRKPPAARLCVFMNKCAPPASAGVVEIGLGLKSDPAVDRVLWGVLAPPRSDGFLVLR